MFFLLNTSGTSKVLLFSMAEVHVGPADIWYRPEHAPARHEILHLFLPFHRLQPKYVSHLC
ncbi:MAG: hypothetical protein QF473_38295, partial [Planctomycetota bacterium]|nr:hypothetical protein [Planctomycetota bacterium]